MLQATLITRQNFTAAGLLADGAGARIEGFALRVLILGCCARPKLSNDATCFNSEITTRKLDPNLGHGAFFGLFATIRVHIFREVKSAVHRLACLLQRFFQSLPCDAALALH